MMADKAWRMARRWKRVVPALKRRIQHHGDLAKDLKQALKTIQFERPHPGPMGWRTKYDWAVGELLWNRGLPAIEIALVLGCGRKQVYGACYRYGWWRRGIG
jgi:hypothetical protein